MRRHLRIAGLVAVGFGLIVLASLVEGLGPTGRAVGLVLGVVGLVTFVVGGFWYTALFVRELLSREE